MIPHLDVEEVAKKIGAKTKVWPGNCHAIASELKTHCLPKAKLRRGHWLGPIAPHTMFAGKPVVPHSWLEVSDVLGDEEITLVVDPTRWVFEAKDPYVYQAPDFDGYYDIGGNALRMAMRKDPPSHDDEGTQYKWPRNEQIRETVEQMLTGERADTLCIAEVGYVANTPLDILGIDARGVYTWICEIDLQVSIPMDNWDYVMGG